MKIQAQEGVKALNGKDIVTSDNIVLTVGNAIANMLIAPKEGGSYQFDKVKSYVLAQKFYSEKVVEVDDSDLQKIKKTIESDTSYGPIVSGFILLVFDKLLNKK